MYIICFCDYVVKEIHELCDCESNGFMIKDFIPTKTRNVSTYGKWVSSRVADSTKVFNYNEWKKGSYKLERFLLQHCILKKLKII